MLASSRKPAMLQGSAAGEIARPTRHPQAGGDAEAAVVRQARQRADASIGPYAEGRHSTTVIHLSCLPSVCHNIVGRAFTPAGEVCGGPEGYW